MPRQLAIIFLTALLSLTVAHGQTPKKIERLPGGYYYDHKRIPRCECVLKNSPDSVPKFIKDRLKTNIINKTSKKFYDRLSADNVIIIDWEKKNERKNKYHSKRKCGNLKYYFQMKFTLADSTVFRTGIALDKNGNILKENHSYYLPQKNIEIDSILSFSKAKTILANNLSSTDFANVEIGRLWFFPSTQTFAWWFNQDPKTGTLIKEKSIGDSYSKKNYLYSDYFIDAITGKFTRRDNLEAEDTVIDQRTK